MVAAIFTSMLFATIHFMSPARNFEVHSYSFFSGFEYLGVMLSRLFLPGVGAGWLGLFLVGLFLCYVMYRSNSLYLCIGIHSGWIIAVKSFGYCFRATDLVEFQEGTGARYFLVAHPLGWLGVLAQWLLMVWLISRYFGKETEKVVPS